MSVEKIKIADFCYVTDYVANGSFASLKEEVKYDYSPSYAILVRVTDFTKKWNDKYVWVDKKSFDFLKKSELRPSDLIMANVGETGKCFILPDLGYPMTLGPNSILIRPELKKSFSKFLFYYFISKSGSATIQQISSATSQSKFNKTSFRELLIPLPTLSNQKKITAVLDKADELRRKDQQLLAQYDALLQSVFVDKFEHSAKTVKLSSVCMLINDGVHFKPNYTESGIPFISVKNVTSLYLDFNDCKYVSHEDHEQMKKRCFPRKGDILYTKVGATYGRASIVDTDKEFSLYVSVCLIKPKKDLLRPNYLKHLMNSPIIKRQADRSIKGAGVPDLHLVEIRNFDIPLPSLKEQEEFEILARKLEDLISLQKNTIAESEALFQTLLQKAFNGELIKE